MDSRFDRVTFESVEFLSEATEAPKIKPGESSSSNLLNRYFNAIAQDVALLITRANILASRSNRIEAAVSTQSGALLSSFQSLSSRVDSASGYSSVMADMHSSFYINTISTTANINKVFGQATLPELAKTDLLIQVDPYGNKYVSNDVSYMYSTDAGAVSTLSLERFTIDYDGIFMLKDDQTWVINKAVGQTEGTIKIKAPLQFRGLTPNVLEIWPFPAFGTDILNVYYRKAGDTLSTWTSLDLSYCPRWNGSKIAMAGPIRVFLPNEPLVEIAIRFDVSASDTWGLKKLKLYHTEYSSSASLVVKDPYNRTIGDVIVRGKDQADLSTLAVSSVGNQTTINLTSSSSVTTPVITGILLDV